MACLVEGDLAVFRSDREPLPTREQTDTPIDDIVAAILFVVCGDVVYVHGNARRKAPACGRIPTIGMVEEFFAAHLLPSIVCDTSIILRENASYNLLNTFSLCP